MEASPKRVPRARFSAVSHKKAGGKTYTPKPLADFVARQILDYVGTLPVNRPIRLLDPAIGDGELVCGLLDEATKRWPNAQFEAFGFDRDDEALEIATRRIRAQFPKFAVSFTHTNFLEFVLDKFGGSEIEDSISQNVSNRFDIIIANPPYVRTQVIGSSRARLLADQFRLSGRVDLYHAFILGIAKILHPQGVAGLIVSNRFLTTRSGTATRRAILKSLNLRHVWDLGDTKIFDDAVLPAVLIAEGKHCEDSPQPAFSSIYESPRQAEGTIVETPLHALAQEGIVRIDDGRRFHVRHGNLNGADSPGGVWRLATKRTDAWLATINDHSWGTFRDIGKIRVGVKTCADQVFIRSDWDEFPEGERPELLRPLMTHHAARRFKSREPDQHRKILYPHEVVDGRRRAVDLSNYPHTYRYLERHRSALESRKYVIDGGRHWYEIWVPQDPLAWRQPKLVFRDIADEPTFWIDLDGSVVNGDCYWMICDESRHPDLLWLAAAIANSRFIEHFYDVRFHNKLYAGRRRYITQYVEHFPLPDPTTSLSKAMIRKAKEIYKRIPSKRAEILQRELEEIVWNSFGLAIDDIS